MPTSDHCLQARRSFLSVVPPPLLPLSRSQCRSPQSTAWRIRCLMIQIARPMDRSESPLFGFGHRGLAPRRQGSQGAEGRREEGWCQKRNTRWKEMKSNWDELVRCF
ncbi:hypothetical protein PVAP13_9NG193873 [Panicum virgatum]|uniref:Uncharacterized protein n=1 Tax=Panicum virgatum TaxID=38727 RepID=A0A8T0MKA4_PANVG|nr:hypothetical protein PVAP13_9NG193873 [Panicum virgatum]